MKRKEFFVKEKQSPVFSRNFMFFWILTEGYMWAHIFRYPFWFALKFGMLTQLGWGYIWCENEGHSCSRKKVPYFFQGQNYPLKTAKVKKKFKAKHGAFLHPKLPEKFFWIGLFCKTLQVEMLPLPTNLRQTLIYNIKFLIQKLETQLCVLHCHWTW